MVYLVDNRTACFGFCLIICFVLDGGLQKQIYQDDESIEELIHEYLKLSE